MFWTFVLIALQCVNSDFFLFSNTATTETYTYCHTLSLHGALPSSPRSRQAGRRRVSLLQQLVLLGALAAVAFVIVRNTIVNLQARGLASGFDFLWQEAGFNVGFSLIAVDASSSYGRIFLVGLLNSLLEIGRAHV